MIQSFYNDKYYYELNGLTFYFNPSFKTVLKSFQVLEDDLLRIEDKIYVLFNLLIDEPTKYNGKLTLTDATLVVNSVLNIFSGYEPVYSIEDLEKLNEKKETKQKTFDWEKDAERIYASFKGDYNIDILKDNLTWKEFTALFENLNEETPMMKAIYYRTVKLPTGKEYAEERKHIRKMKKYYSLNEEDSSEELTEGEMLLSQLF